MAVSGVGIKPCFWAFSMVGMIVSSASHVLSANVSKPTPPFVATEVKDLELMDFAAESEEMSGGGLQSEAEGARLSLETDQERVRTEESGDGEAENGLTGMEKTRAGEEESRRRAEEMRMDLTVVKQEVMDWSEMVEGTLNGQWVKQEEDRQEVKEEKPGTLEVKEEMVLVET